MRLHRLGEELLLGLGTLQVSQTTKEGTIKTLQETKAAMIPPAACTQAVTPSYYPIKRFSPFELPSIFQFCFKRIHHCFRLLFWTPLQEETPGALVWSRGPERRLSQVEPSLHGLGLRGRWVLDALEAHG